MSLPRAQDLVSRGDYPQAESLLLRHLRSAPKDPDALHLMCYILAHTGRLDQALYYAERAVIAAPTSSNAHANLGTTLVSLGREDEGIAALEKAVQLNPSSPTARHALALALNSTARYTQARDLSQSALAQHPDNIPLALDLADSLQNLAQADAAVSLLQSLATKFPIHPLITGNLAAATNYASSPSPDEIFQAHKNFAAALAANLPPPSPPPITDPDPDRPIRLGIIIPDLVKHSVAYFIRPVLERLDAGRFTPFIYYTGSLRAGRASPPAVERQSLEPDWPLPPHTARRVAWEPLPRLNALIRADRLDILIDLCGMSSAHRLQLMHVKPAPIQLTYAGYPNTTGIPAIDYRIVDSLSDPPNSDHLATETLLRLDPCFLCFTPEPPGGAGLRPSAEVPSHPLTFGSFNHLPKLNDQTVTLWSRLLAAVPNSRLILKATGLKHPATRAEIESRFIAAGVPASRLSLLPPTATRAEHLALYSQIHIALDTFPYHGTTTTCEALSMGVPVVTLAGTTHVSRVGVSLLTNVGLPELIAATPDDYIRIASQLATDKPRLEALRRGLPDRFRSSPLCDAAAFATRFQALLRTIWQDHVRTQHQG